MSFGRIIYGMTSLVAGGLMVTGMEYESAGLVLGAAVGFVVVSVLTESEEER